MYEYTLPPTTHPFGPLFQRIAPEKAYKRKWYSTPGALRLLSKNVCLSLVGFCGSCRHKKAKAALITLSLYYQYCHMFPMLLNKMPNIYTPSPFGLTMLTTIEQLPYQDPSDKKNINCDIYLGKRHISFFFLIALQIDEERRENLA